MAHKTWRQQRAVVVCGVHDDAITEDGTGVQRFDTLEAARKVFSDLDPETETARFTGAMESHHDHEMRFETHQAFNFYTSKFTHRVTTRYAPRISHKRAWEPPVSQHD